MRSRSIRKPKGFTLTELIIVIVVLGILATIAIAGYTAIIRRANISSVERSAVSFVSELNNLAAQKAALSGTQSGLATDKTARDQNLIAEALLAGDGPKGVTIMLKDNDGIPKPFVTWNGGLVCSGAIAAPTSGTCASADTVAAAEMLNNTVGPAQGINNTAITAATPTGNDSLKYIQFVKNGASVCVRLSADGTQASDITPGGTPTGEIVTQASMSEPTAGYGWIVVRRVAKGSVALVNDPNEANACNGVEGMQDW